jgi:hypothetical protein
MLFESLRCSVQRSLDADQYSIPANGFIEEVSLVMQKHPEGEELLIIQPYFLRALHQLGFVVDFHFRLKPGVTFDRRVQQLSLSLDKGFRRNADHHVKRTAKIRHFLAQRWTVFSDLRLPGAANPIEISKEFTALPAERLRPKTYVFAADRESRSQFAGLRDFGPLEALGGPIKLLFAFREQDRQAARRLAAALKGLRQPRQFTFPGFKKLFKTEIEIDPEPIVLPNLAGETMELALARVKKDKERTSRLVPVIVLPSGDDNGYLEMKARFSNSMLPTQVCTLKILEDQELLKWSIANLALQIFCKAGGQPWKVRPGAERCLIIGISQSHKIRLVDEHHRVVDKYFAFSVLTDSSGLFQKIRVLADADNDSTYLFELRRNLKQILEENAGVFKRVVIHTSFKLKRAEMIAIQRTTEEVAASVGDSGCKFAVIKVNPKNRFFGLNRSVNSLVPFEGTQVRLGPREYLVWFEGISLEQRSVARPFPGPTHLQFLHLSDSEIGIATERELLQDIVCPRGEGGKSRFEPGGARAYSVADLRSAKSLERPVHTSTRT